MLKRLVRDIIAQHAGLAKDSITVETPPDPQMGDFALPCFALAKHKDPATTAKELAKGLRHELIAKAEAKGPFLNLFLDPALTAKAVLADIAMHKKGYGKGEQRGAIMIEYSQPNTHKEFHVGHLRTLYLGESLARLKAFQGTHVTRANYIGDVGAHVAKALWCYTRFHAQDKVPENKGQFLGRIYTEAVRLIKDHPEYKEEAGKVQQALENKDKDMQLLWLKTREWSLKEFDAIYEENDIRFDVIYYESEVEGPGKDIVGQLKEKGLAVEDDGAVVIDLEDQNLKKFLLLKSDGTSLYSTKDLALAQKKFQDHNIDASYYVVDSRQSFYFRQLFATLKKMGFDEELVHIPYEFVSLPEGVISSRTGNIALYEDFRNRMLATVLTETEKRHKDWDKGKLHDTARVITFAALKFGVLRIEPHREMVFDLHEALNIQGETGPYVLYALARAKAILRKAERKKTKDYASLNGKDKQLVLFLARFPEQVRSAAVQNKPSLLCRYVLDLAQAFNEWYHEQPVIQEDQALQHARLHIVESVVRVLENGLDLLGIQSLDEM